MGALFAASEQKKTVDTAGATAHKEEIDKVIAALDEEIKGLAGKDNKKARTEKEKEKKKVQDDPKYIDACKVVKGLEPKNGNFLQVEAPKVEAKKEEAPKAEEDEKKKKDEKEKPKKSAGGAGISPNERAELD